jgi:lactoylglutathione lyase
VIACFIEPVIYQSDETNKSERQMTMKIAHAASWVSDLERACAFYERWFKATKGPKYSSTKRSFTSYFLSLDSGARLELMASPSEAPRMAHIAVSVGSREAVDRLIEQMKAAGVHIVSDPRVTGDGFYEAVVTDTEGNLVEITSSNSASRG